MKKLWNMKYADMTYGEVVKAGTIATIVISAVYVGIWWVILKLDDIMSAIEEFRDKISDKVAGYKGKRVSEEDEGLY